VRSYGHAVCRVRQETRAGQPVFAPRQGQVPGRRRPQGDRDQPAHLQAQPPDHPVPGGRLRPDDARVRAVHPQWTRPAPPEAPPVPDAEQPVSDPPSLSAEEVRWIAHLARLELTEAELTTLTGQLSAIVGYVAQLGEVDTEGVEPLAHALPVQNVFREDDPAPSLGVDEALANAPQRRRK